MFPSEKGSLVAVVCNAVWSKARVAAAGLPLRGVDGAAVEATGDALLCDKCGRAPDTVFHRCWVCDHPEAVAARTRWAPPWLVQKARAAGEDNLL